ncbi:hypothetical protein LLE49_06285 [Alicyclobacillus tolerans]|uniref:hypothetical protein n=1 Tax=Alicyclobacillus tolerans TaxID=90970 RepID=UPI001F30F250|nr:hypothetical protein [Alicyclobacillus tolerans]MCF8564352.1 hypothetical protein [Alicyclobacillus tolerans]
MITRAYVMPYVGQRVVVRTRDGVIHHGILHSVTDGGLYLRRMGGANARASGPQSRDASLLNELPQSGSDVSEAWWPLFFLPWLAVAAFWPWGLWW